jgi:SAM-dependent methyltransferase
MHTNSRLLFETYALPSFRPGMRILEIGPESFPSTCQRLTQHLAPEWHTLDVSENPLLTYPASREYSFDIPDESYDVVISANVIEHVKKPWRWIPELARVARHGGLVITVNPVSWIYHEAPVDCWRIYPEGMRALYEEAGLTVTLSRWESLEAPHFRRHYPGISAECQSRKKRLVNNILGRLGMPVERSYDTITMGRKHTAAR